MAKDITQPGLGVAEQCGPELYGGTATRPKVRSACMSVSQLRAAMLCRLPSRLGGKVARCVVLLERLSNIDIILNGFFKGAIGPFQGEPPYYAPLSTSRCAWKI